MAARVSANRRASARRESASPVKIQPVQLTLSFGIVVAVGKGEACQVSKVEEYSAIEMLRDECQLEIRALRPDDRADLIEAVGRTSDKSLYRRFFGLKHSFTAQEAASSRTLILSIM